MSCTYRHRDETILAYVRQELPAETQEAFEAHYFSCEECATEVIFYEKTLLAMKGQGGIVFARRKKQQPELILTLQHFVHSWNEKFPLLWGEGGAIRALAGYAILIVFMGVSSFWLLHTTGTATARKPVETDAVILPLLHSPSTNLPAQFHLEWPAQLRLSEDRAAQTQLDQIQPQYQIAKDYAAAGRALAQVLQSGAPIHDNAKLFFAVCLIQQERNREALAILTSIPKNSPASAQAAGFIQHLQGK